MWAVWWEAWESARSHELRMNCKGQHWSRIGVRFMSLHRPWMRRPELCLSMRYGPAASGH